MIVYLGNKQQTIVGIGTVGFEIVEMPWQINTFSEDNKFMLKVVSNAKRLLLEKRLGTSWDINPE